MNRTWEWVIFYLLLAAVTSAAVLLFWPGRGLLLPYLQPKPETFTELYFTDHLTLPRRLEFNTTQTVPVTIQNREGATVSYPVVVRAVGDATAAAEVVLHRQTVTVAADQQQTLDLPIRLPALFTGRVRVEVVLENLNQRLHFWVNVPDLQPSPSPTPAGPRRPAAPVSPPARPAILQ